MIWARVNINREGAILCRCERSEAILRISSRSVPFDAPLQEPASAAVPVGAGCDVAVTSEESPVKVGNLRTLCMERHTRNG